MTNSKNLALTNTKKPDYRKKVLTNYSKFPFGKYVGNTIIAAYEKDPGYLEWWNSNIPHYIVHFEEPIYKILFLKSTHFTLNDMRKTIIEAVNEQFNINYATYYYNNLMIGLAAYREEYTEEEYKIDLLKAKNTHFTRSIRLKYLYTEA